MQITWPLTYLWIGDVGDGSVHVFHWSIYGKGEVLDQCVIERSIEELAPVRRPPDSVIVRQDFFYKINKEGSAPSMKLKWTVNSALHEVASCVHVVMVLSWWLGTYVYSRWLTQTFIDPVRYAVSNFILGSSTGYWNGTGTISRCVEQIDIVPNHIHLRQRATYDL